MITFLLIINYYRAFECKSFTFSNGYVYGRNAILGFGDIHPDFMDAIMPLASLPVEIAGRNRMQREPVKAY
jgi:hypothetical protein